MTDLLKSNNEKLKKIFLVRQLLVEQTSDTSQEGQNTSLT